MKLYYTPTSPFVRKVLSLAHAVGLASRIETVFLRPSPLQTDPELSRSNPLSKIPALRLEDGTWIYDSAVICEYLDGLHGGRPWIPKDGLDRYRVLRLQALCDGILEAAVLVFYERAFRPAELHWAPWLDGQTAKVRQGLDALEAECADWGSEPHLGHLCAGATLGWLEFRNVVGDLRQGRPRLTAWYERFSKEPYMVATAPRDGV